jgi:hypothetical protein
MMGGGVKCQKHCVLSVRFINLSNANANGRPLIANTISFFIRLCSARLFSLSLDAEAKSSAEWVINIL